VRTDIDLAITLSIPTIVSCKNHAIALASARKECLSNE
jgi:hypothetical protein